jgi:hypothetical protein
MNAVSVRPGRLHHHAFVVKDWAEGRSSMRALSRFLDELDERRIAVVPEFPPACVPIRSGTVALPLDGLFAGDAVW